MSEGAGRVAIVVVSHSRLVAEGAKELAAAMAPDVHIGASGGDPDGGLGSSFDMIEAVIKQALLESKGAGAVVLADLGSAILTVDAALEFADQPRLLRYAPGPLIEGAVAAAVEAQGGGDIREVAAAVSHAARSICAELPPDNEDPADETNTEQAQELPQDEGTARTTIADRNGLHARSAAKLAVMASGSGCKVWVDRANAASVVELMCLGSSQGQTVTVRAKGPDAQAVAQQIADAIAAGFDGPATETLESGTPVPSA